MEVSVGESEGGGRINYSLLFVCGIKFIKIVFSFRYTHNDAIPRISNYYFQDIPE